MIYVDSFLCFIFIVQETNFTVCVPVVIITNFLHVRLTLYVLFTQIKIQSYLKAATEATGFRHKYACTECEKRYTTKGHLKQHMQLHTGQFSFYCNECGKGFNAGSHYKDHVRAHRGIKYHCEYFSKPFKTGQAYRKHRSLHESEEQIGSYPQSLFLWSDHFRSFAPVYAL